MDPGKYPGQIEWGLSHHNTCGDVVMLDMNLYKAHSARVHLVSFVGLLSPDVGTQTGSQH